MIFSEGIIDVIFFQNCHFIRCIKPNSNQTPGVFDFDLVSSHLQSAGIFAYSDLMQMGYPSKIQIEKLFEKIEVLLDPRHVSVGKNMCCQIFLLGSGFQFENFKFGRTEVRIRAGKFHLLDNIFDKISKQGNESTKLHALKFKRGFVAFRCRVLFLRLRFLGARTFCFFLIF